uniref:Uncharacterized protein n=1 Tax=Trieres chinensis TaxID=1514140 RepID=A0A7S2EWB6_TRICV|mmetsp:Transcript_453/g.984  ORF Transcript_453/g.984 Transcript_453/m.984 type:complete len:365 (+) Transcript_453:98-1192(+)
MKIRVLSTLSGRMERTARCPPGVDPGDGVESVSQPAPSLNLSPVLTDSVGGVSADKASHGSGRDTESGGASSIEEEERSRFSHPSVSITASGVEVEPAGGALIGMARRGGNGDGGACDGKRQSGDVPRTVSAVHSHGAEGRGRKLIGTCTWESDGPSTPVREYRDKDSTCGNLCLTRSDDSSTYHTTTSSEGSFCSSPNEAQRNARDLLLQHHHQIVFQPGPPDQKFCPQCVAYEALIKKLVRKSEERNRELNEKCKRLEKKLKAQEEVMETVPALTEQCNGLQWQLEQKEKTIQKLKEEEPKRKSHRPSFFRSPRKGKPRRPSQPDSTSIISEITDDNYRSHSQHQTSVRIDNLDLIKVRGQE